MFSHIFLAKTGQELAESAAGKTAYLSCHFSPYGKGLGNLPTELPAGSLLILDDSMPPKGHDAQFVARQLQELVNRHAIHAVLLDFQNKKTAEAERMAAGIAKALPCPVAVTEPYAKALQLPVFLSPPPANIALQSYLKPWRGQDVFLEVSPMQTEITITPEGSFTQSLQHIRAPLPLEDLHLHCHYRISVFPEKVVFTVMRTGKDLSALAEEALQLGVSAVVGLYQELKELQKQNPTG